MTHPQTTVDSGRIVLGYPVADRHRDQIRRHWSGEVVAVDQSSLAEQLPNADIFCGHVKVPVDWDQIVSAGRLRWIQSSAAGLDHCVVPQVVESDIVVSGASGLFADQVAEQTMALILGWLRSVPRFVRAQVDQEFIRRPTHDLKGKTVGIVGLGGNGRRLAEVLAPWNVRIFATDVFPEDCPPTVDRLLPETELHQLLSVSDIVVLCMPLTPETHEMIGAEELAMMPSQSLLVNVARGQVVDEPALIEALQSGQLAGAALDVVSREPLPAGSPLWGMPQVLITPHVGAQSEDRVDVTTNLFCTNIGRYLAGNRLLNLVDKRLGFPRPLDRLPANWSATFAGTAAGR